MTKPAGFASRDLPEEFRSVQVASTTDPTAVGDSIEVLRYDMVSLDPAGFELKRISVPLEDCCLIYVSASAALRTRTVIHEHFESIFISGPDARGSVDGATIHPYELLAAGPGADPQVIVETGYKSIALMIPAGLIGRHLEARSFGNRFEIPDGIRLWRPEIVAAAETFELGKRIVRVAENSPEVFNASADARYGARFEYLESLLATIESCVLSPDTDAERKSTTYSQIVRACEAYTLDLDGRRPHLSELCEFANVSRKTLHNAFRDILGMSPIAYLNRLRLHRARNQLRQATSDCASVTDVALHWGFWHFGEFSQAYRKCFGELPSETLRTPPP